jgi:hypothetical protein
LTLTNDTITGNEASRTKKDEKRGHSTFIFKVECPLFSSNFSPLNGHETRVSQRDGVIAEHFAAGRVSPDIVTALLTLRGTELRIDQLEKTAAVPPAVPPEPVPMMAEAVESGGCCRFIGERDRQRTDAQGRDAD